MARTKKDKDRTERVYRRRQRSARADAAAGDLVERRVALLPVELTLAQLEAIPAADRGTGWDQQRDNARRQLEKQTAELTALEAYAVELAGKPPSAKEAKERREAIARARAAQARDLGGQWEDTLAAHERNLAVLAGTPAELRGDDYEEAVSREEEAVVTLERALAVLDSMFPDARAPDEAGD